MAGAVVLATSCRPSPDVRFFTPPLRSDLHVVLHVRGDAPPSLQPELQVEYQTRAAACKVTVDKFAGVSSPRIYQHRVTVLRVGSTYDADLPLDLVDPGECDWAPWGVNFVLRKDGRPHVVPVPPTPLLWFKDPGAAELPPIAVNCVDRRGLFGGGLECEIPGHEGCLQPVGGVFRVDFRLGQP